jgi:hypothetical protein
MFIRLTESEPIHLITYIPLAMTLISSAFTLLLWRQFRERRKLHQLV